MSLGIQPRIDSLGQRRREHGSGVRNAQILALDRVLHSLTRAESDVKLSPRVILLNGKEPK